MESATPVEELLDCQGPNYESDWGTLYDASVFHQESGAGPYTANRNLLNIASRVVERWQPHAPSALQALPNVLRGLSPSLLLAGFCAHGFLTARFWQCFDISPTAYGIEVADCLQELASGPVTTQSWGPLEFSESTRWPTKIVDIRLFREHWSTCALKPVTLCPDIGIGELRARSGLRNGYLQSSDSSHTALHAQNLQPSVVAMVAKQMNVQPPIVTSIWRPMDKLKIFTLVVIGSHAGSNMEPLSLVLACLRNAEISVSATVYGTTYPFPELICDLFGYCSHNEHIDEIVGLLVRQMYNPHWEPNDLLVKLRDAITTDNVLRDAELLICAQPMPVCSLLRGLVQTPIFVYQAFPLIGATPVIHKQFMLLHFQEMFRIPSRSAFVVYSEFLASQFEYQVGHRPLCLRPHSLYATNGVRYDPDRENPRIAVSRIAGWARDGAQALVHLTQAFADRDLRPGTNFRFVFLGMNREPSETVGGIAHPFGYYELRRFRAAVFFPWDFGMLLFSELYNIGVPLLVPSRRWMVALIKRMLEYTDFGWWQARSETSAVLPGTVASEMAWPWLDGNSSIAEILSLYDQTDFVRWPYVESFNSLPELMAKLPRFDYDTTSEAMHSWNAAALHHSMSIASQALSALLSGAEAPIRGASSCV